MLTSLNKLVSSRATSLEGQGSITRTALDVVYRESVIILTDLARLMSTADSGDSYMPLIGFTYEHPSQMTLLKYEYSEYPFLDKTLITNSYMKQNTDLTVRSYRGITAVNGVVTNIALNELLFKGIEAYCDRGGTFRVMTMWGTFNNYVLEELTIVPPEGNQTGGIGFEWKFKRIPFDTSTAQIVYSASTNALSGSLVPVGT